MKKRLRAEPSSLLAAPAGTYDVKTANIHAHYCCDCGFVGLTYGTWSYHKAAPQAQS